MSEWKVIRENFHTKHSVLTAPDEHMPYIIQLHIMSIRWAYYEQMKQQNIWSVHTISIGRKKPEVVNAYHIKNSMREKEGGGERKKEEEIRGGDGSEGSRKDWAELYGYIKQVSNDQSLQWQSLENLSLSLPERDEKLELEL